MGLSRERARLIGRLRTRRTREREGLFLVEGIRAVGEALDAGAAVRFALVSERMDALAGGAAVRARLAAGRTDTVAVDAQSLADLSDTEASQGVLLVCAEPPDAGVPERGALLVLDGIQDPGNVGTLVRAAAAFGAAGAVVLDGTADPFGAKAVRAAAGALFRLPIARASWAAAGGPLQARGPLLVADMGGVDAATVRPAGAWSLVIGGEGAGARPEVRAAASATVSVPMRGGVESLNAAVAGAILLYELTRGGAR